jgi:uncharacterized protein (TIGR00269 family)
MIDPTDRVLVAVSGGKDSVSLLVVLRKLYPKLRMGALYINLGIPEYSDHCEKKFRELVDRLGVEPIIYDIRKELGIAIPEFERTVYRKRMCSPCGTIKRYLMNKVAVELGFTKLATGHNLDDLAETIFSSYLSGDVFQLVRLKPVLPSTHPKFVAKIKPLWNTTESENLFYAMYNELPVREVSCPLASGARSLKRKRILDLVVRDIPGFKHALINSHLQKLLPALERSVEAPRLLECRKCGMPASADICAFCKRVELVSARS